MLETRKRLIAVCTDMMLETRKRLIAVCTDDLASSLDYCYPVWSSSWKSSSEAVLRPINKIAMSGAIAEQCFSIRVPVTLEKEPTLQQVVFLGFAAE